MNINCFNTKKPSSTLLMLPLISWFLLYISTKDHNFYPFSVVFDTFVSWVRRVFLFLFKTIKNINISKYIVKRRQELKEETHCKDKLLELTPVLNFLHGRVPCQH